MTMHDVGGGVKGGTMSCMSHLRQGHGVVDDSDSTLYRTPWYSTYGASNGQWCRPTYIHGPPSTDGHTLSNVSYHTKKIVLCLKLC